MSTKTKTIVIKIMETELKQEVKAHTSATLEYYLQKDHSEDYSSSPKLQKLIKLRDDKKSLEDKINKLEREIDSELFIEDFKRKSGRIKKIKVHKIIFRHPISLLVWTFCFLT